MRFAVGRATDVGLVRDGNEDNYLVDERLGLFAVADGMGGHRAGEVASATALEALRAAMAAGRPVHEAVTTANAAVRNRSLDDDALRGMGTTLTAIASKGGGLIGHVGDSRAYRLRDGILEQLTVDHSLVEELVREGRLTPEQAAVHPKRSIITRALGIDTEIEVDLYAAALRRSDRVLLCSDGLTTMVRDDDIARLLTDERDPQRCAESLVAAANAAGGEDNITIVVLDVLDDTVEEALDPAEDVVLAEADPAPARLDAPEDPPGRLQPTALAAAAPKDRTRTRRAGRTIARVVLFVLPVVAVLAVAVGAVAWYARQGYFVGVAQGEVVLYQGVPGGLFGIDPTIEERTGLPVDDLCGGKASKARNDIEDQREFSSRSAADDYLERLAETVERCRLATTTTSSSTTTSSTATTAPPPVGP